MAAARSCCYFLEQLYTCSMIEFSPENLGDTKLIHCSHDGKGPVGIRLVTDLEGSMDGIITDVRLNNAGESLFSWGYYNDIRGGDHYQPHVSLMIAVQERIRPLLAPHITNGELDSEALKDTIGFGGHCGG